jgi:hypothetical protein
VEYPIVLASVDCFPIAFLTLLRTLFCFRKFVIFSVQKWQRHLFNFSLKMPKSDFFAFMKTLEPNPFFLLTSVDCEGFGPRPSQCPPGSWDLETGKAPMLEIKSIFTANNLIFPLNKETPLLAKTETMGLSVTSTTEEMMTVLLITITVNETIIEGMMNALLIIMNEIIIEGMMNALLKEKLE